jgi:glycosyltransferase involved in cell wall biosynthesis
LATGAAADVREGGARGVRILLLSRYSSLGASSRYRSYQYLPFLRSRGHAVDIDPLLGDLYLRRLYSGERAPIVDVLASYVRRKMKLLLSRKYDLLWIEYEAFPWMPYWMESLIIPSAVPYVVDYDDAVFHRYDKNSSSLVRRLLGSKIDRVMGSSALVIAGNEYLADRARKAGARRVEILPTVIDLEKYPVVDPPRNDVFTIGWIGTPQTMRYLQGIQEALKIVCKDNGARLRTIGAASIALDGVPIEAKSWSESTEVEEMQKFDVGIMPLADGLWERGKCGHKLIQYMGCSRPVVASPVGANSMIVEEGKTGFLASTAGEWVKAFQTLKDNQDLGNSMGRNGRKKVEQNYSLSIAAPRLATYLEDTAKGSR